MATSATSRTTSLTSVQAVLLGTGLAVVANLVLLGLSRLAGHDLVVSPPGQEAGTVPSSAVVVATVAGGIASLVLAVLVRRLPRPAAWFTAAAAVGLLLSMVPPFAAAEQLSTGLWLAGMHVVVAAAIVPMTARALIAERQEQT